MDRARDDHFGFIMEQTLGHVTHYRNLRSAVDGAADVVATWMPLEFEPRGRLEALPTLHSNWTLRASLRAARLLASQRAAQRFDALFFHTQVTTLLSAGLMRRVPTVISLDATPSNYDVVGAAYGHRSGGRLTERAKRALNRRPLSAADAIVTWCEWARQSLIHEYAVPGERITVIPPGIPLDRWPEPKPRSDAGPTRLLFVGGDFERKGGTDLLRAFSTLPEGTELHLVTKAEVPMSRGVHVYRDLGPNSEGLMSLYAQADVFVLPTLADCFPLVIQEAMAMGLPVVSTDVGAIGEAVTDGQTGFLVPPADTASLAQALHTLIDNPSRRAAMGNAGRLVAEARFDSAANARRILEIMRRIAAARQADKRTVTERSYSRAG